MGGGAEAGATAGTAGDMPSVGGAGVVSERDADAGRGCRSGRGQQDFSRFVAALTFPIRRRRGPLNPWSAV
jgi:hypothetical protein